MGPYAQDPKQTNRSYGQEHAGKSEYLGENISENMEDLGIVVGLRLMSSAIDKRNRMKKIPRRTPPKHVPARCQIRGLIWAIG
jgi:hypothetical protein